MKKYLLILIFCLTSSIGHCQIAKIAKQVEVPVLTAATGKLNDVLDLILSTEKERTYYRADKYFTITVLPDSTLQIQATDYLFTSPKGSAKDAGVILHDGHSFFVSGRHLDPAIFRATDQKKRYSHYTDSVYKDEKGGMVYLTSHDDGYSSWIYKFIDGDFKLIRFCETSDSPNQ